MVVLCAVQAGAPEVCAETRLMLEVGQLQPLSTLANAVDGSLFFAGRAEFQEMDPGQKTVVLSLYGRLGYSPLDVEEDLERSLKERGQSPDASYLTLSGGVRLDSESAPLFVGAGLGYANYDPPGELDGRHGFELALGGGLSFEVRRVHLELEIRGHRTMLDKLDDITFLTVTGAAGFHF